MSVDRMKNDPEIERIVASAKRMAERANVHFELDRTKLNDFPSQRHDEEAQEEPRNNQNQSLGILQC